MAQRGLVVMKRPRAAAGATLFQTIGWSLQLLAVYTVMRAFDFGTMPAAALVLVLMNVATVFPFWPGNVGLLQAAIALPLRQYGVAYGTGFAFGLALQAVEMSVGVGLGLAFLAREGSLVREPDAAIGEDEDQPRRPTSRPRARRGAGGRACARWPARLATRGFSALRPRPRSARGLRAGGGDAAELPIADGGEGRQSCSGARSAVEWREADGLGSLGRPVRARWLVLPDGRAVVEAAAAIGLPLLTPEERDPLRASSQGSAS